ncbi:MAG TPA: porin, partial [Dokdonella sp.]
YSVEGLKIWAGGKAQKFYLSSAAPDGSVPSDRTFNDVSGEVGASFSSGPFGFLANVQYGKGIGILSDGDQGATKGFNYLVQGSYKLTDKLKFGLNYGKSQNKDNDFYNDLYNLSFKSNDNVTGGLYYQLTKSVTLAAELVKLQSKDYLGNTAKQYGGDIGGIIFF